MIKIRFYLSKNLVYLSLLINHF